MRNQTVDFGLVHLGFNLFAGIWKKNLFVPTIENGEQLCIRFFLFSTQNQVPQIMIKLG